MAHKVTIECEARFVDHLSNGADKASDSLNDIGSSADKAEKKVDKLGKKKFKPIFDADNNKFLKKIREAEARAEKLGKTKTTVVLKALDKATNVIGKVLNKAQSFGNRVWTAILKVKDSNAMETLKKVIAAGKTIAGSTWSAVVSVKDKASSVISNIKNSLFNLKNLAGTLIAGYAVKQATNTLVSQPVGLADSIESSRIAFESKLGSAEKAEAFLQDIYKFDEKSPFDTLEIVGITQQMMNLGWTAENVLKDLGTIGDWSASLGKGEDGISAVTRALGQMRMKGKLSSEEMLQLTEAGVDAWNYLAQYMGTDIRKVREMAEDGAIDVDTAIKGIMNGMSSYAGSAAALADRTVSGIIDQIKALFKTYVVLPWGEGLSEGFKNALSKVRDLVEKNKGSLKKFGETAKEVGLKISSWFSDKVENALKRITEITESEEFKKGSLTKKINMLWEGVIKNPFSDWWTDTVIPWWDNTAMPWLEKKVAGLGKAIGKGLTSGLLVLLGFDAEGAIEDGSTIGGAFMEGFLEGFDTDKIGEALKNWANENKGLATILGAVLVGKGVSGIGKAVSGGKSLWEGVKGIFGKGTGDVGGTLLSEATGTMNVTAGVVNVYGLKSNSISDVVDDVSDAYTAKKLLDAGSDGAKLLKSGDTALDVTKAITKTDDAIDMAKLFGTGGKVAGKASKIASKAAPVLAVLDFVLDGVFGFAKSKKEGDSTGTAVGKGALKMFTGEYEESGAGNRTLNAVGNTAKWAGTGALIGSVAFPGVGTAIGAGVGAGVGLASNLIGQGLDTGVIQKFFKETLPEGWNNMWDSVGNFFTETVPYALGYATGKVHTFFTETIPNKWNGFWDDVDTFIQENLTIEAITEKFASFKASFEEKWGSFLDSCTKYFSENWSLGAIKDKFNSFTDKVGSAWDKAKSFFSKGFSDGSGGGKARGGIVGGTSSSMEAYARGGIVGGSTRFIRVNEESPEMIIPLSSQRRDRAMKLWAKTGQLLGAPGFARGGRTTGENDEGIRFHGGGTESDPVGTRSVVVQFGDINIELKVDATDKAGVAQAIKEQIADIAESVAEIFADEFESVFENTPVRGGVA